MYNRGNPSSTPKIPRMTTSNKTSEVTYKGIIAFRPNSLTPLVRVQEPDGEIILIPIMVEDYDKAREMEGEAVRFTILTNPYGPHIVSENGYAKLL